MARGQNFAGKEPETSGRKKGTPNKNTKAIKEAIERAFSTVGGEDWLVRVSKRRPEILAGLIARILPKQVEQSGPDRGPIIIRSNIHD